MNNVRDFGAIGDGISNDTKAIQAAIDKGGMVNFPPGIYRIGTIYLKSNGGLHLEAGAVLQASHYREDYNSDDFCPQNEVFASEHVTGAHLIVAVEQQNIVLEGDGIIDGQAFYWMTEKSKHTPAYLANPERPGQLVYFCECQTVRVTDIQMIDGSYWHLFLHGCMGVSIRGVRITASPLMATNDGIDIDCCQNVVISDCNIQVGDDAIAIRGNDTPLKNKLPCENVCVTNCILSSFNDNAIRVGVGRGIVRNCRFSNLTIYDSCAGICIINRFTPKGTGVNISNVSFDHLSIHAHRPILLRTRDFEWQEDLPIPPVTRDISFSNLWAESDITCEFLVNGNGVIDNLKLENCEFRFAGKGPAPVSDEEGWWNRNSTENAIEVRGVTHGLFDNVKVVWLPEATDGWKHDLNVVNSPDLILRDCCFPKGIAEN